MPVIDINARGYKAAAKKVEKQKHNALMNTIFHMDRLYFNAYTEARFTKKGATGTDLLVADIAQSLRKRSNADQQDFLTRMGNNKLIISIKQKMESLEHAFKNKTPEAPVTLPYVKGSETSQAAAKQMSTSGRDRNRVMEFIKSKGKFGATDEEVQLGLALVDNTQRPRRVELENSGVIFKPGLKRKTIRGRQAGVYVHSDFRAHFEEQEQSALAF